MRLTELQEALLQGVGEHLKEFDFRRKNREQSFIRPFSEGRSSFHLSFIKHRDDFDVTADMAVRFDAVGELLIENSALSEKDELPYSLGIEVGNLTQGAQKRWSVHSPADVAKVAATISATFRSAALPYFEKYEKMENAYQVLQQNDRESWRHSPIHGKRAVHALALAVLLGRHGDINGLISQNTAFLASVKNKLDYDRFVSFAEAVQKKYA